MVWKLACETEKASPHECMNKKSVARCYNGEHCIAIEIPRNPHTALGALCKGPFVPSVVPGERAPVGQGGIGRKKFPHLLLTWK